MPPACRGAANGMAWPAAGSQWSEEDSDPIPKVGVIVASRRRDARRDARGRIGTVFLVGVFRACEGKGRIDPPIQIPHLIIR